MSTLKVDNLQTTGGAGLYPARSWANVNCRGTVAIRNSGNVSSMADNGVGDFTLNFSSTALTSNWCLTALGTAFAPSDPGNEYPVLRSSSGTQWSDPYFSTSNCRVEIGGGGGYNVDMGYVGVNVTF